MTRRTAEEVRDRVVRRMEEIDRLTPAQRQVVHDYGWAVVKILRECNVLTPKHQIMIINKVLTELCQPYRDMAQATKRMPPPPRPAGSDPSL